MVTKLMDLSLTSGDTWSSCQTSVPDTFPVLTENGEPSQKMDPSMESLECSNERKLMLERWILPN